MAREKYWKIWSLLLTLLILTNITGCGTTKERVVTNTEFEPRQITIRSRPEPVQLFSPYFYVVTDENISEFLANNKRRHGGVVFVAIDVQDYEKLALNTESLNRFIKQLTALVVYYEDQARRISSGTLTDESE